MSRKVITFLGTSANDTVYEYQGHTYQGKLFQIALRQFVEFEEMLVFTTPEAKSITYPFLKALHDPRIKVVDIRRGTASDGLWQIFDRLVQNVDDGDTVIFDITHGLRSIFFLTFLAAAYLRSVRNEVTIEAIFYGAYELGQNGQPAPVIDLSEFVSLLDWLTAAERFTQTGDGRPLANLLRQAGHFEHPRKQTLTPDEQAAKEAGKRITLAAKYIEEVSGSLLTNLFLKAEAASHHLTIALQKAEPDLAAKAHPYRLVAENIRNSYLPFANAAPMNNVVEDLRLQLAMIRWYLANGQIPQGATLMREWVVTALGYQFGLEPHQILAHKGERRAIEETLGRAAHTHRAQSDRATPAASPGYDSQFNDLPNAKQIAKFWNDLIQFRNLINHGAMKQSWEQESRAIITNLSHPDKTGTVYNLHTTLEQLAEILISDSRSLSSGQEPSL